MESITKFTGSRKGVYYLMRGIFFMGIRKPPQRYFLLYCLWSFLLNFGSTFYQPVAFMIGFFTNVSGTLGEFLNSLQIVFNACACSCKVIVVWKYAKNLDTAVSLLDRLDERLKKSHEQRQIQRTVNICNKAFFSVYALFVIYASSVLLVALVKGIPPYQNYYPLVDWRASIFEFYLQSLLEYLAIMGSVFQNTCNDGYPVMFLLLLRTHMRLFGEHLRQLGTDESRSAEQNYTDLVECIEHHKAILKFCEALRPVISGTIFVQLLVTGIVLGITLLNIMVVTDYGQIFISIALFVSVLIETSPICLLCTLLISDCENLTNALFQSNWISGNVRYKKTVAFFVQNLQKPISFKAMNLINISLATNLSLFKFAFSVFTVMNQMNIAEKFQNMLYKSQHK